MADIVQKVKYQVEVNTAELDRFKTAVDETNAAIGRLNTAFRGLSTSIDQGMLKALSTLNGRLSRFTTVATPAVDQLEKMVAPMSGLATAMTRAAEQFAAFTTSTNRALDDLRKFNTEMGRTKTAAEESAAVQERAGHRASLAWLKMFGVFQSAKYVFQEAWRGIKEGAQQMDLERILDKQFSGFESAIRRAQELTSGTVAKGDLTKSYALMSSFGIPMDKFAENMELVQKMAIRTGQSASFLTESFARGISRLSPLILDNLGIQVSLGDANAEWAAQTGKATTEMTKQDKIAALLAHTLGKLKANTDGVSLSADSAAASVNRAEAAFNDALMSIKKLGGSAINGWDLLFQSQQSDVAQFADLFKRLSTSLPNQEQADNLNAFFAAMAKSTAGAEFLQNFENLGGPDMDRFGKISEFFADGARNLAQFDRAARGAADGSRHLQIAFDVLKSRMGGTEGDVASAAVFDLMARDMAEAKAQAEDLLSSMGDLVSEKDRQGILDRAAAAAQTAAIKRMQDAIKYAKANNLNIEQTVVLRTRETDEFSKQVDIWAEVLDKAITGRQLSAIALKDMQEQVRQSNEQLALLDQLFEVKNGTRLAEIELNNVLADRRPLQKALEDAQKELAAAEDDQARVAAQRAIIAANTALVEQDALRQTAQAAVLADKAVLESYQSMSKEKLREMKTLLLAQISMLHFGADPLLRKQKDAQIAEMQNTLKIIDDLLNKKRSGGSGSIREEYEPFKPIKTAKPTYYGWTIDDLLEVGGKLQEMREGFSIGGQVPGGFFGDSDFLGSVSADEVKKAQERLAEFDKARSAALGRFRSANMQERGLLGAFSDEASVEAFRTRLQQLADHFRILDQISTHLENTAVAMGTFRDGMDGLFGSDVIGMVTDFTSGMEGFTEALRANAGAYGLVNAAMPMVQAFTQNIIKNRKAQAAIEALMQGAASWAAYASGNVAGGTMHAIAAGMYLAVAGGVLRLPKGKGKDTKPDDSSVKSQAVKGGDRHFHWHGQIATTEAERGAMIRDMIREAERAGI